MANDQETDGPGEPATPVNQGAAAQGEQPKVIPDAVAADEAGQAAAGAEGQDDGAPDDGTGAAPDQRRVQPTPPEPEVPANLTLSSNPEVKVDGNIAAEIEDA